MKPKNLEIFSEKRLLILQALFKCNDNICGCDLVDRLKMSKNLVSHHLKKLEQLDLLERERCGKRKKIKIKKKKLGFVKKVLKLTNLYVDK